jgi:hypothetical protein
MADLKLPDVEPVGGIISSAGAIDRAGAQFKQAADTVGGALLQHDMADVAVQMQEAELQTVKAATDTLHIIKSAPYISPEQVKGLFPGGVPPSIDLTEEVAQPGGKTVRKERAYIPMHEVAKDLIDQEMTAAVVNASEVVKAPGWSAEYQRRALGMVEKVRAEALDWQRGQRLADLSIRSTAQFEQAMDRGLWPLAENILSNADWTMDVRTRETLRAQYPERRAKAEAASLVRDADTFEALDAAAEVIGENIVRSEKEDGLFAPLDPETQRHYLKVIDMRRKDMIEAEEQAKVAKFDQAAQTLNSLPPAERRAWVAMHPEVIPPRNLRDIGQYRVRKEWFDKLMEDKPVTDNNALYLSIYNNPEAYRGMSEEQFRRRIAYQFTSETEQEVMRLYADRKAGKREEPVLTSLEMEHVKRAARRSLGIDPGATISSEMDDKLARTEEDIAMLMMARKRANPNEPITYGQAMAARDLQTTVNTTAEKGIAFTRPMTDAERQTFYGLDNTATAEAWKRLWKRTHGGAPVRSNSDLYDLIDNATKEWGADVDRAWGVNPLEQTPALRATVIARLADRDYVARMIDPMLPADSKADPKVLRRRRVLAAVQLSAPSGAPAFQAKLAEQEAAVVRAEQLQEAVARREANPRVALTDRALRLATRDMPSGPKTYDWWTGKMPAEAQGAARAAWESDMAKRRVLAETAVEMYEQYLARNGVEPGTSDLDGVVARKKLLYFHEFYYRFEKGTAP